MAIDKITTYVANADERTLSQFDNSPRLQALIQFFAEQHQELEDVLYALLINHTLDTATGDMLEKYGVLIGWPRVDVIDDDDDDYRAFLNTAIKVNISDARAITIIEIFTEHLDVIDETGIVRYVLNQPAAYKIEWITDEDLTELQIKRIQNIANKTKPLGVDNSLVQGTSSAFRLDSELYGLDNGTLGRRLDVL